MKIGEVCLLTNDVVRLANFYKALLFVDNGSEDDIHQFILSEETTLTIHNDGTKRKGITIIFVWLLLCKTLMWNMKG